MILRIVLLCVIIASTVYLQPVCSAQVPATTGYVYAIPTKSDGKQVWIIGQRPLDKQGKLVGKGNLSLQIQQVFINLKTALASVKLTVADIKQITYHIRQLDNAAQSVADQGRAVNLPVVSGTLTEYKNMAKLLTDDMLVEVEIVAIAP